MTPRKNLIYLRRAANNKISKLRDRATNVITVSENEKDQVVSYVVIEALNTWNNFLRAYYLSCTISTRSTKRKKVTVSVPITSFNDAIGHAIACTKKYPPTLPASGIWDIRDEPTWHDINNFTRACQNINCSNIADINSAFSIGSRVYTDLPIIRNYYAHRNRYTARKVKNIAPNYGISDTVRPTIILFTNPLSRSQPLILDLLDDLYLTVEFLCEGL